MKRFVLRTLLFLSPFLVLLGYFLLFVDQEAMRGDIGRMTQRQFRYAKPSIDTAYYISSCRDVAVKDIATLSDHEIVVFGDSFSSEDDYKWHDSRWHQFMGGAMGSSIVMTGDFLRPVDSYLSTLTYYPELLSDTVLVESVERETIARLCYIDFDNIPQSDSLIEAETSNQRREWWRTNKRKPLEYYQRRLGINVPVNTAKLDTVFFSCRPNTLYYYQNDTITHNMWEIETALANLQRLDSISKSKGITMFFVAIPDKYTTYRQHITDINQHKRLLEETCPFDSLPYFINTLPVIDSLIKKGVVDVYLPDDTHFSIPTAKAIGEYVANQITLRP